MEQKNNLIRGDISFASRMSNKTNILPDHQTTNRNLLPQN